MILMLFEMGSIIENSLFPFMVGSLITSATSMAGRVSSDFTSEHKSSLHTVCASRDQVQLCHVTLPCQSTERFFFLKFILRSWK